MALDYSKMSDAELQEIANSKPASAPMDFSKMSDSELQQIVNSGQPANNPSFADTAKNVGKDLGNSAINLGLDVASGLALGTGDLLNLVSGGHLYKAMGGRPPSFNEMLHRPQNFVDKIIEGGAEFAAPGGLVSKGAKAIGATSQGLGNIARQGAASGLLGGFSHAEGTGGDPALEGALGFASGAFAPYLGKAAVGIVKAPSAIKQGYNEFLLNNIAPKLLQKELTTSSSPENTMLQAEGILRDKFNSVYDDYKIINEQAKNVASKIDQVADFDSSHYVKSLKDMREKLNPYSKEDAPKIKQIDDLILLAPKKLSDAIDARIDINKNYPLNEVSKTARKSLIDSVDKNIEKYRVKDVSSDPFSGSVSSKTSDEAQEFHELWKDANKKYSTEIVPFFKKYDAKSNLKNDYGLKETFFNPEGDAQGNLINLYVPKGDRVDTLNQGHLGKLIGENDAMKAARAGYFKDSYDKGSDGYFPTPNFMTKYRKLSNVQKEAMFPEDKIQLLDLISEISTKKSGQSTRVKKFEGGALGLLIGESLGQSVGIPGIGGAVGATAGYAAGDSIFDALLSRYANPKEFMQLAKAAKKVERK